MRQRLRYSSASSPGISMQSICSAHAACNVQRAACNSMSRTTNTTHKMQRATCCAPCHDAYHTKHSAIMHPSLPSSAPRYRRTRALVDEHAHKTSTKHPRTGGRTHGWTTAEDTRLQDREVQDGHPCDGDEPRPRRAELHWHAREQADHLRGLESMIDQAETTPIRYVADTAVRGTA